MDEEEEILIQRERARARLRLSDSLGASQTPPAPSGGPPGLPAATGVLEAPTPLPSSPRPFRKGLGMDLEPPAEKSWWRHEFEDSRVPPGWWFAEKEQGGRTIARMTWSELEAANKRYFAWRAGPHPDSPMRAFDVPLSAMKTIDEMLGQPTRAASMGYFLPKQPGDERTDWERAEAGFMGELVNRDPEAGWGKALAGMGLDILHDPTLLLGIKFPTTRGVGRVSAVHPSGKTALVNVGGATETVSLPKIGEPGYEEVARQIAEKWKGKFEEPTPQAAHAASKPTEPPMPAERGGGTVPGPTAAARPPTSEAALDADTAASAQRQAAIVNAATPPTSPPGAPPGISAAPSGGDYMRDTSSRVWEWIKHGRKGFFFGDEFSRTAQRFQHEVGNIPGLAKSEAASVRNAFEAVQKAPQEAYEAVANNLYYGTPVPEAIRGKYGAALPALRHSLSDLQELHKRLQTISPEVLEEYPIWVKRLVQEPLEQRAAKGFTGAGAPVGVPRVMPRQDAYTASISGINAQDAAMLIEELPENLRPLQPSAPGISKGLVQETPDGVLIKWPNTPEGEAGRAAFERGLETHKQYDASFARKTVRVAREDPLPSNQAQMQAGAPDPRTIITDLPTILGRSWVDVLRHDINGRFFARLPGMTDSTGEALTKFVSANDYHAGKVPPGYEVMQEAGVPGRRWGALNAASDGEQAGYHAVRSDLAQYLREADQMSSRTAEMAHGFLDAWARNATNAPKTGFFNWLYNKGFVDIVNGVPVGTRWQKMAKELIRKWETTGVAPQEIHRRMQAGLPMQAPDVGMSSIADEVDKIMEDAASARGGAHDAGKRLYEFVGASPLAERPVEAAVGGALQSGVRALAEGEGLVGAAVETAVGAAQTTVLRKPAQWLRTKYLNSDLQSTLAASLRYEEEALARGLSPEAALAEAVEKASRRTQAGQWGRVGGLSEAIAAAPSGLAGSQQTGVRAVQKALLNRFLKWYEVDARMKLGLAADFFKGDWRAGVGLAAGAGTIYALKRGGEMAAESMGLITPEEAEFTKKQNPGTVIVPFYDEKRGPSVAGFPGQSIGHPLFDSPDSVLDAVSRITGPVAGTAYEGAALLAGGPEAKGLMGGLPIVRREKQEGTMEETSEAAIRQNQERWLSPWAFSGRVAGAVKEQVTEASSPVPGHSPPGIPHVLSTLILGRTRPIVPAEEKQSAIRAFSAQMNDLYIRQYGAGKSSIPGVQANTEAQYKAEGRSIIQRYLSMGLTPKELGLQKEALRDFGLLK